MITSNQKLRLEELEKQYVKLNLTDKNRGNLIDVSYIIGKNKEGKKELEELRLINVNMKLLAIDILNKFKNSIESDFNQLGIFLLERKQLTYYLKGIDSNNTIGYFEVIEKTKTVFVNDIRFIESIGFKYRFNFGNNFGNMYFDSNESFTDLISTKDFKDKLQRMYNFLNK
tara:strand:- start:502 stop:1014 length:513 start_codon:yes stop_codon:yes gene_type:complete